MQKVLDHGFVRLVDHMPQKDSNYFVNSGG